MLRVLICSQYDFYTIIQKGSLSTTFEDCLLFINFKAKKHG